MLGPLHIDLQEIHPADPLPDQKLIALHDGALDPLSCPAVGIVSEGCMRARDLIVLQSQGPGFGREPKGEWSYPVVSFYPLPKCLRSLGDGLERVDGRLGEQLRGHQRPVAHVGSYIQDGMNRLRAEALQQPALPIPARLIARIAEPLEVLMAEFCRCPEHRIMPDACRRSH